MKLTNIPLAILVTLSMSATANADYYRMYKCFCRSSEHLAVVRHYHYEGERFGNAPIEWIEKTTKKVKDITLGLLGIWCPHGRNDPNTCQIVPDPVRAGLIPDVERNDGYRTTCTSGDFEDLRGHYKVCGSANRIKVNNVERLLIEAKNYRGTPRLIRYETDCTDVCRDALPEDENLTGACNQTALNGPHVDQIFPLWEWSNEIKMARDDPQCKLWEYQYFAPV
ncbi:MAG: hypothetical protein M1831_001528 [Alyxoria varia]|nr:MAG: hypothetical protein M1831_001528 [Alyxoria varia]